MARLLVCRLLASAMLVASWDGVASAQTAPEASASSEIMVTAQRREQRLQDVPISISALSGGTLSQIGLHRTDDLQFAVPSVTFLGNNSPQGQLTLVRGQGTFSFSDAVEPSVGTVVDNVPLGRQAMGLANFFDVARVEVLKGPQGTLFGKNASAGLINISTKNPSFTPHAEGEFSYGNYSEALASAAITGPLSDQFAVRLAGFYQRRDGYVSQPVLNTKIDNLHRYGGRAKLLFKPKSGLGTFLLTAEYQDINERCCEYTVRALGSPTQAFLLNGIVPAPGPGNFVTGAEAPILNHSKIFAVTGETNLDVGADTLTLISSYRSWRNINHSDGDGTPLPILGAPGDDGRTRYDQFSQEIRLTAPETRRFGYTLGLYYFTISTHFVGTQSGNLGLGAILPPGFLFTSKTQSQSQTDNVAAFGEVYVHATEKLRLTAGARVLHDNVNARFARLGNFPLPGTPLGDTSTGDGSRADTSFVARAVAQYQWTKEVMTYASVARGYKGFGADTNSPLPGIPAGGYGETFAKPETNLNYEVGARTQLFDRRLTLNGSAFWTDVRNLQLSAFNPTVSQYVLQNVARSRTRGVEADFSLRPVAGLTFSGSGAYIDATFRSFPNLICTSAPSPIPCINGARDVSGRRSPLAPEFSFTVAADYQTLLPNVGFGLFGRVDYSWKDKVLFNSDQDLNKSQGAYGLINARAGVFMKDDRLRIAGYIRNATNKRYTNLIFDTPIWGGYSQYPEIGRTYGVQVNMTY